MFLKEIKILNFRKIANTVIELNKGVNAFVGENNSGKTAIIDAIRLCLGARSYEMNGYITEEDFNDRSQKIDIQCKFIDLTKDDISKFLQYLTYENKQANLYVNLVVENGLKKIHLKKSTGRNYDSEQIEQELLDDIICTYLKPLRDAESELSAKKYSRILRILEARLETDEINKKIKEKGEDGRKKLTELQENIVKLISDFIHSTHDNKHTINTSNDRINEIFQSFLLKDVVTSLESKLSPASSLDIRSILEKFELSINGSGRQGLGYNNILFMAAEMLLLEEHGGILLIEEPEAHLHPQLQLCFMQALEEIAKGKNIQVIISTHSVTLASKIPVEQLILVTDGQGFSLAQDKTKLRSDDYKFLSKFLDATKANLFFAKGVLIVEGDAENILLPSIANIIGKDLTRYGVSIVKVGARGSGLSRWAKIFSRNDDTNIPIKIAILGDEDTKKIQNNDGTEIFVNKNDEPQRLLNEDEIRSKKEELKKDLPKHADVFLSKLTFEYYLMTKSDIFKSKILAICKTLKPEITEEIKNDNVEKMYKRLFIDGKDIKTEVALRLAIAIDGGDIEKVEVEKLVDVIGAITHVTTGTPSK